MDATPKTLLIIAMQSEAKAFVEHFGLTQDVAIKNFRVYRNDQLMLLVSGIGKVKSAFSTSWAMANIEDMEQGLAVNVGIAGAQKSSGAEVGEIFLVNKIVDRSSRREFFPDMLLKTEFEEAQITTFDRPVRRSSVPRNFTGLVDMEASGFFEAARAFLAPHRIACLKIVSDHLDGKRLDAGFVEELVSRHAKKVERFIERSLSALATAAGETQADVERWVSGVSARLRLTASQKKMLGDWATAHLASGNEALPDLPEGLLSGVRAKTEGKQRLERIREILGAR